LSTFRLSVAKAAVARAAQRAQGQIDRIEAIDHVDGIHVVARPEAAGPCDLAAEPGIVLKSAGIAAARLADERGYFDRAIQSVVIEKRSQGAAAFAGWIGFVARPYFAIIFGSRLRSVEAGP